MEMTVHGYYDGNHIVLDENVPLTYGERVTVKILSDNIVKKNAKKKPLDFAKYRVGKEYNLPMDAQEYVRALRDVDDFVERKKSSEEFLKKY